MAKRAVEGIQQLIDRTGGPDVVATVTVNQPYAQDQHETLYYRHPRGGMAKYLETPLMSDHPNWIQQFANRLLNARTDADRLWGQETGRPLVKANEKNAPVEFGDLRDSAGLEVKAGGSVVMSEPPKQRRLTDEDILAKDYMRHLGLGYR